MDELKQKLALAALEYVDQHRVLGIGTGSTANHFIAALTKLRGKIDACVASSKETEQRLRAAGFAIVDLNQIDELPLYIDGTDEVNTQRELIKGAGGALTREKIIATVAKSFLCLAQANKLVRVLGEHPIAIEVLPIARSFVARQLVCLNLQPNYRHGFVTDNGNCILDVYAAKGHVALTLEDTLNQIPGVIENGIFARRPADIVLLADTNSISKI